MTQAIFNTAAQLQLTNTYWSKLEDIRKSLEDEDKIVVVMFNGIGIDSDLLIGLLYTQELRYKEKVERLTKEVNHA